MINTLNKKTAAIAAIAIIAAALPGCSEIADNLPLEPREVIQAEAHYPVEIGGLIFDAPPQSAASLSPALTEIICELGYANILTRVSAYCDYPDIALIGNTHIGSAANPDVSMIISANPELLLSMSPIAKKDIAAIEETGTRVLILQAPSTVEALYEIYHDIAAIFGGRITAAAAAEEAVSPLKKALAEAEGSAGSFVYIMNREELSVAPPDTFIGDFFSLFGENIIKENGRLGISAEELSTLAPEYIFMTQDSLPLDFPPNSRVIVIDQNAAQRLERPTSRLSFVARDILRDILRDISSNVSDNLNEISE